MFAAAKNWAGLVIGSGVFLHEALTGKDPTTMTIAVMLMGFRYALNGAKGKRS